LSQLGVNKRRLGGWRVGVAPCAITAFVALLLNVIVTIAIAIKVGMPSGIGTLFHGSCGRVESLNFWIHLAINVLSTALLSGKLSRAPLIMNLLLTICQASNYCMQCLSAPTRDEINSAHAQGKWLDIGVPSIRNLTSIARKKGNSVVDIRIELCASSLYVRVLRVLFIKPADHGHRYNSAVTSTVSISHIYTLERFNSKSKI
jgi:hypothetical protein